MTYLTSVIFAASFLQINKVMSECMGTFFYLRIQYNWVIVVVSENSNLCLVLYVDDY